jgi:hypothetical protein
LGSWHEHPAPQIPQAPEVAQAALPPSRPAAHQAPAQTRDPRQPRRPGARRPDGGDFDAVGKTEFLVARVDDDPIEAIAAALGAIEDDEPDLGWTIGGAAGCSQLPHNLAAGYVDGNTREFGRRGAWSLRWRNERRRWAGAGTSNERLLLPMKPPDAPVVILQPDGRRGVFRRE